MAEKQKGSIKNIVCKIRLNKRESQMLNEICKYSGITKSDAIHKALRYYYDDQCPCNTEQKNILAKAAKKVISTALNFPFLSKICLYLKPDT